MAKKKAEGQVFTPLYLVCDILNVAGYKGKNILKKQIIDNSCGDGAFLCEIVRRYIDAYKGDNGDLSHLKEELETYIHGIELDPIAFHSCLSNLSKISNDAGIPHVKWDILNADTLTVTQFNEKMDFVVGNPPYVRVHNLESKYSQVKHFQFAKKGMTDLYLVFFEIGFRMLNDKGKLCYITPSSWLNSIAGDVLRKYIRQTKSLETLVDLEHVQAFEATTYTIISLFSKKHRNNGFLYAIYDIESHIIKYLDEINYDDAFIDGNIYLASIEKLKELKGILEYKHQTYAVVKNGFATLNDKVFIRKNFPFTNMLIDVVKASSGEWKKALYPYDENGVQLPINIIKEDKQVWNYLTENKPTLVKDNSIKDGAWYLYGRTQALKDVSKRKYAINTILKDIDSIKLIPVPKGMGVYSGLYILTHIKASVLRSIIISKDFLNYIRALKKYKSGGYYTFSSKELQQYLNYKINKLIASDNNGHEPEIFESNHFLF